MPFTDTYGLALTTNSARAAETYNEAMVRNLEGNSKVEELLAEAVAADEGFALAHAALARQLQFRGEMAGATASKERARNLTGGLTRRERQHVEAIARGVEGDGPGSLALIREHLTEFPRDAYLLSQCTGPFSLIGFGGGPDWRQENFELLQPLESAYGDDWWFLSAYSFAHNELYHFEEARRLGERSLQLNPRSAHGSHSMAHVYYETGDDRGGVSFLEEWLPGSDPDAILHSHLVWHLALFELVRGNTDHVTQIYGETLNPQICPGFALGAFADAASLCWRHDLYGLPRPEGSEEDVAAFAKKMFPRPGITFADVHAALAYAASGDAEALEELSAGLNKRLEQGKIPAGDIVPTLVSAIAAFGRGDYEQAVSLMEPAMDRVVRIGGSNAQREVIEDTLLEAYVRARRFEQALALLRRRLDRRPNPRDERWLARTLALTASPK